MKRHRIHRLAVNGQTLVVIEEIVTETQSAPGQLWYASTRRPVAVVLDVAGERVALGIDGTPLDPSVLSQQFPAFVDSAPTSAPT